MKFQKFDFKAFNDNISTTIWTKEKVLNNESNNADRVETQNSN